MYNKYIGLYWIDPNGGCINDAVEVFCNFSKEHVKTCIHPVNQKASIQSWTSPSVWFSKFTGGFQVSPAVLSL